MQANDDELEFWCPCGKRHIYPQPQMGKPVRIETGCPAEIVLVWTGSSMTVTSTKAAPKRWHLPWIHDWAIGGKHYRPRVFWGESFRWLQRLVTKAARFELWWGRKTLQAPECRGYFDDPHGDIYKKDNEVFGEAFDRGMPFRIRK